MDQKTLEWMAERVTKGKAIMRKIEELNRTRTGMIICDRMRFFDKHGNTTGHIDSFAKKPDLGSNELIGEINTLVIEAINREITRLEQELAEL
ncbi:hypothetical protein SAMN05661091_4101 [Paenibacillus uliginis N3/975]|uniref:Uncharacterized protein n=1 Tax=Paenibacillus uliginis N3/975 TaxID=1313296 RepID=A0A1X7HK04_9BACL|nr:hypothetical protein [Paenibacillus uliginis]SMF88077.1 hypothetical protein SAMN05661091_4101 [Paenibacillus uliginis N3/975]